MPGEILKELKQSGSTRRDVLKRVGVAVTIAVLVMSISFAQQKPEIVSVDGQTSFEIEAVKEWTATFKVVNATPQTRFEWEVLVSDGFTMQPDGTTPRTDLLYGYFCPIDFDYHMEGFSFSIKRLRLETSSTDKGLTFKITGTPFPPPNYPTTTITLILTVKENGQIIAGPTNFSVTIKHGKTPSGKKNTLRIKPLDFPAGIKIGQKTEFTFEAIGENLVPYSQSQQVLGWITVNSELIGDPNGVFADLRDAKKITFPGDSPIEKIAGTDESRATSRMVVDLTGRLPTSVRDGAIFKFMTIVRDFAPNYDDIQQALRYYEVKIVR